MKNSIKLKSLKELTEESDGLNINSSLQTKISPKHKENWNEWWKDLAPSRTLWKEYLKDKKIEWPEYVNRFIFDIRNNPEAVKASWTISSFVYNNNEKDPRPQHYLATHQGQYHIDMKHKTVTLLCHRIHKKQCHRSIVKGMIAEFRE